MGCKACAVFASPVGKPFQKPSHPSFAAESIESPLVKPQDLHRFTDDFCTLVPKSYNAAAQPVRSTCLPGEAFHLQLLNQDWAQKLGRAHLHMLSFSASCFPIPLMSSRLRQRKLPCSGSCRFICFRSCRSTPTGSHRCLKPSPLKGMPRMQVIACECCSRVPGSEVSYFLLLLERLFLCMWRSRRLFRTAGVAS